MTLDEAIAKYKEITNTDANCPIHCMRSCDKCVQESGQFVEWLEELKVLRHGANELRNAGYEHGRSVGYRNAIDDFVRLANTMPTVEEEDGEIRPMWLEEIAEQLKGAKQNEDFK